MFEWCSIVVMRISSSGRRRGLAKLQATRFIASVAPRTKITSRESAAPMNRATRDRAAS
jgi:hypothetical protein